MAGTRITMSSLKQILLLRSLGTGKNKIARITNVSKVTINDYLDQITRKSYVLQDLIQMDDPAL
jgi:DNA-binding NarL/FixJ family response regulator